MNRYLWPIYHRPAYTPPNFNVGDRVTINKEARERANSTLFNVQSSWKGTIKSIDSQFGSPVVLWDNLLEERPLLSIAFHVDDLERLYE